MERGPSHGPTKFASNPAHTRADEQRHNAPHFFGTRTHRIHITERVEGAETGIGLASSTPLNSNLLPARPESFTAAGLEVRVSKRIGLRVGRQDGWFCLSPPHIFSVFCRGLALFPAEWLTNGQQGAHEQTIGTASASKVRPIGTSQARGVGGHGLSAQSNPNLSRRGWMRSLAFFFLIPAHRTVFCLFRVVFSCAT